MTPQAFIATWNGVSVSERANYQLFFNDLCALLGVGKPAPAQADDAHNAYVFERYIDARDNVLEKLHSGEALTPRDKTVHEQGLVGVLKTLHDELDTAVLAAYGWDNAPDDDTLLARLVELNARRAREPASARSICAKRALAERFGLPLTFLIDGAGVPIHCIRHRFSP